MTDVTRSGAPLSGVSCSGVSCSGVSLSGVSRSGVSRSGIPRSGIPRSRIPRRSFLRGVAGGGFALFVAPRLPSGAGRYGQPQQELLALTAKEYAVVRAAARALLPGVPVDPDHVALAFDREVALIGEPVLSDMKAVLGLIEHLTILDLRFRRFSELDPKAALEYLNGWATSRFNLRRAAFHAVRTLVHFIGWSEPETRPLTGFEGTWPERFDYPAYPVDFGGIA